MPKAIIFDTETTGTTPGYRIIEAAFISLNEDFKVVGEFVRRYDPLMPISFGAMSTHHILDEDVKGLESYENFSLPDDVEYIIGHKVDYDWEAVGKPLSNANGFPLKRICTLALARKHLPEVDSHNQVALMYYFFGKGAREYVKHAHSALADVRNCYKVLTNLMGVMSTKTGKDLSTLELLWQESERCRIPATITFGKHKGMNIKELPNDYVAWLYRQSDLDPYLRIALDKRFTPEG